MLDIHFTGKMVYLFITKNKALRKKNVASLREGFEATQHNKMTTIYKEADESARM